MISIRSRLACFIVFVFAASTFAAPATRPVVWMGPPGIENGKNFRALFEHPDQWAQTRSLIDGLLYTDLNLNKQFTDEELAAWFAQMKQWNLKLSMEVGAIKPWGLTGQVTFAKEKPMWDRLVRLGAALHSIAMDEPFLACRQHIHQTDDYALEQTALYIIAVRNAFPDLLIGDIEPYPSIPRADHVHWLDLLNARLKQANVRGLDFYRLDVNWSNFVAQNMGSWRELRQLELECRKRKIPFSLIYWASEYPPMLKRGYADDSTWYVSIMRQGYDYLMVDGHPDEMVIESWVGAPLLCIPETQDWTFTRSVRDFVTRFAKSK